MSGGAPAEAGGAPGPAAGRVAGAAGLLAGSVLAARALGYLRDLVFAAQVGVGSDADAYFAAFLIPDILGYLLAAGAAATAVTPPYLKRLEREGPEAAARFASVVVGSVGAVSIAATIGLWIGAEPLVRLQFPKFDAATLESTVRLMRIVLPAQVFFLTGGVLRGVLMAHGLFWPQALASVVYSAVPIAGGLLLGGPEGFAWGALVGAAIGQWAIPAVALRRLPGAVGRMRLGLFDADFREYVWLALPLMLGFGLTTVDEWYEKWVGGQLEAGAIAAITYARKLMMAPVGVVGQAVGAALLPSLTALYQRGDPRGFDALFERTLRATLGLGVLASGALWLLSEAVVVLLYERRAFTPEDTRVVTGLLRVLTLAVPGWVVQQVAVRGFYARGEMWRAMALSTAVALAVIPLYVFGASAEGVRGLAMASVAAISLNAAITVVWLRRRIGAPRLSRLLETTLRSGAMAGLAVVVVGGLATRMPAGGLGALATLTLGGALYAAIVVGSVRWLGDGPMREQLAAIAARLRRS